MTAVHIVNARIYSMEKPGDVFSSMTIEQGRISFLGHGCVTAGSRIIDLEGRTVLPGFTDAHCHFMPSAVFTEFGFPISTIQNNEVWPKDFNGLEKVLKAGAKQQKKNIVLGFNLVTTGLREKRMPTMVELDSWLPGKMVVIFDNGGHSSAYSKTAIRILDLAGIHDKGVLTGEAHEFNMGRINRFVLKSLTPQILARGICGFVNRLHGYGITGVHCMEGFDDDPQDWSTKVFAAIAPVLPLHIRLYCQYRSSGRVRPFFKKLSYPRLGGCGAWEMDGAVSAGTAAFYTPYKNPGHTSGQCYYTPRQVETMVNAAVDSDCQIAAHAIGPRAIEPLLSALEKQGPCSFLNHRIEHFEFPTLSQVKRAVDAGIFIVPQPGWTWVDNKFQKAYNYRLTKKQIQSQIPLKDIVSTGGIICGSSDSPVQEPDPLAQIRGMCDFPVPGQSISRFKAVQAYTLNSARAGGDGQTRGSLAQGKLADFIVLNKDIMDDTIPLEHIRVEQTIMAGQPLDRNRLTPLKLLGRFFFKKRRKI